MLITLLVVVIILALIFWVVGQLRMPQLFKSVIGLIVVIVAVIYLLRFLPGVHIPGVHL